MSRGAVQGFQASRLSQILAIRRLTQAQLASLVGVSPATISKWRAGTQVPELTALDRLASVVNVETEWFMQPTQPSLSSPLFRSNAAAHVVARSMLGGRLEWAEEIADRLLDFVDFPTPILPSREFRNPEEITCDDIEAAADECRTLWRLGSGPIQDLSMAVEGAGILVVREETGVPQIEGLSAWSEKLQRPLILLSADKDNGFRGRFDLAHEIGHIILHKHIERTNNRERHNMMEKQAHAFAGALLLPATRIGNEAPLHPTLDDLLLLKRRWGASAAAILMRLKALGIVDADEATNLFKRRSARWGAKSEPGDDERRPELPRLLRRTFELLVSERVIPISGIPKYFGISQNDLEMLAGLPGGYFSRDGDGNVVSIARLRRTETDRPLPAKGELESYNIVNFKQRK